jgi:hypothetical protein
LTAASAGHAEKPSLSVSLDIPSRDGERRVDVGRRDSHFQVILTSRSSAPQRIWQEKNSWGYSALSFEVIDRKGVRWIVRKRTEVFTRNGPGWWTLEPHGHLFLDVYLGDRSIWEGLPRTSSGCETVQMRAVYEVKADDESKKERVWTGRIVSDTQAVTLCE